MWNVCVKDFWYTKDFFYNIKQLSSIVYNDWYLGRLAAQVVQAAVQVIPAPVAAAVARDPEVSFIYMFLIITVVVL